MPSTEIVTVVAIVLAPVFAVQVQKWLEAFREKRRRKGDIFHALMATRGARVSAEHVRALNMIDIEFSGRKLLRRTLPSQSEKAVLDAWTVYRDHLNTQYDPKDLNTWLEKGNDLFVELLHVMSRDLGYEFDKVLLKRGGYTPIAHGNEELYNAVMRKYMLDIANGRGTFPVSIVDSPDTAGAGNNEAALPARSVR